MRLLSAMVMMMAMVPAMAAHADDGPLASTLTVQGDAVIEKPADRLSMRVGVVTRGDQATAALADNSRQMEAAIEALLAAGLGKDDYETGRFSIRPLYSPRPRGGVPAEWQPKIIGYEVSNSITVRTMQLDLAGPLIEAATNSGANSIDSIGFDIKDPRKHRGEAIAVATENAKEDARNLADAASVRLMRILDISLDHARPTPRPTGLAARGASMEMAAAPPIKPGDVTVRASVTITYEIVHREGQE